ncbi:hypothetical protein [Lysinibacillus xylanilyticus]|uniref:hypothetical protein n=1 Tax=Lysinibacillus xylanilyticus TaxID=582475 RepID=UPI003D07CF71
METGRLLGDQRLIGRPPGSSALRESEASATNVLSVRKRSVSIKAPGRNGNQPHVMVMIHTYDVQNPRPVTVNLV